MILADTRRDAGSPPDNDGTYGYLMQFTDGTRIDLGFDPISRAKEFLSDSLTYSSNGQGWDPWSATAPSDLTYLTNAPTEKGICDCCNEFWWLNPYVAKAIWLISYYWPSTLWMIWQTQLCKDVVRECCSVSQ